MNCPIESMIEQRWHIKDNSVTLCLQSSYSHSVYLLVLVGIGVLYLSATKAVAVEHPNVVLILADDLGWSDLGCYGSTFHKTPHIDRLCRRSMKFTNAYSASPLCSPTRASIMTGLWPARIGITAPVCHLGRLQLEKRLTGPSPNAKVQVADSITRLKTEYYTLAEAFRDSGYATAHFGKWHLGPEPYSPLEHGFDSDVPHTPGPGPGGGNGYFAPWRFWKGQGETGDHIDDRMAEEAVKFLQENREKPFLLNFWAFGVHSPWMGKQNYIDEAALRANPDSPQRHPVYAAMVRSLDDAVGELLDTLDELKLTENTIVIFASDNGAWHNVAREATNSPKYSDTPVTSNAPLRSGKASLYEGGTRTPLMVAWPGTIEPGTENKALWQSTDFYPTLVEACQLTPTQTPELDGVSQLSTLRGEASPRETLFCHFPHSGRADIDGFVAGTSVRRGNWKLIRFFAINDDHSDRLELYDLAKDIGETTNLANIHPDLVDELNAEIDRFLVSSEAVVPIRYPRYAKKSPPLDGWHTSADAKLERHAGGYLLVSTGRDPFISNHDLAKGLKGPFRLRVTMSSTAPGNAQVFWRSNKEAFDAKRSVSIEPATNGETNTWEVVIPVQRITSLRIDPARGEGAISLESITLFDNAGNLAKSWPSK